VEKQKANECHKITCHLKHRRRNTWEQVDTQIQCDQQLFRSKNKTAHTLLYLPSKFFEINFPIGFGKISLEKC
jgi:hypothetical protein